MGAKEKLNFAHVQGAVVFAGVLGFMSESMGMFLVIGVILLALAYSKGDIR